jgi:tRNA threonylcarbamoyladenosine biosynthesis protein TsaB
VPNILLIETATAACSVGLIAGESLTGLRESFDQRSHAEQITLFIEQLMQEAALTYQQLDAIAVSKGPGSYTGLRIGVSTAKGICYATDKPLIAIGTLAAMAQGIGHQKAELFAEGDLLCPMIDARRMEVYTAVFNLAGKKLSDTEAVVVDENTFAELFAHHRVWFFGDGAHKCRAPFAGQPNARFLEEVMPSAAFMVKPALEAYANKSFENVAYFEPFYLKDFVAAMPKVKGLR